MNFIKTIIDQTINHSNYSFFILIVGLWQVYLMIRQKKAIKRETESNAISARRPEENPAVPNYEHECSDIRELEADRNHWRIQAEAYERLTNAILLPLTEQINSQT